MDTPDPALAAKWLRLAADPDLGRQRPKTFARYITKPGDEKQWAQFAWRLLKETRQVPTRRAVELYIRKRKGQSNDVQEVDESKVAAVESHFLDSGSFTLWTRAKEWAKKEGKREQDFYDTQEHWEYLDDYAAFVKAYPEGIDLYANVDAIGFPDITRRNQLYLESEHGLTPVPVVHYRSDLSYLRYYVERGDPVVALGGLVGSTGQDHCRAWIDRCFDYVCNTPNRLPRTKVHGFGVTTHSLLWRFPWYCMPREGHEVLTKEGWRGPDALLIGQEILCYQDGKSIWQVVEDVPKYDVMNVDLIHLHNKKIKGVDCYSTWNHRWRVVDRDTNTKFFWKETHELGATHAIPRVGEYTDAPTEKAHSDDFVELVAWYWTEGTLRSDPRSKLPAVVVYQSESANPHKVNRIRDLFVRLAGQSWCESKSKQDGTVSFQLYGGVPACKKLLAMMPTKEKVIPFDFILSLTKEQLELFVGVSVSADGHRRQMAASENFDACLRQKDRRNIDQFRLACILAGYTTSEITANPSGHPEIRLCRTKHTKFCWVKGMEREIVRYTGQLWCVKVPSGAFFVRHNGCVFVTGNSVDSTAWTKVGAFGGILVPHKRKGAWDFREEPYVMKVSDDTPDKRKAGRHFYTLRQAEQAIIRDWLGHINVPLGRVAKDGTVEEDGVVSHHSFRKVANLYFFEGLRAALPAYPWPFRSTRRRGFFP